MALLIVAVCAVLSTLLARRDLHHLSSYLGGRGHGIAEQLARDAGPSLVAGNVEGLRRLAEEARARNDIVYCRFFDAHGLVLVSTGGSSHAGGAGAESGSSRSAVSEFRAAVVADQAPGRKKTATAPPVGGVRVGTVAIGVSLAPLEALGRRAVATATLFTAVFAFIAAFAAILLARMITRPIAALALAADRISQGDLAVRVDVRTRDEVGILGRSFNAMAHAVASNRAALEEKVQELERANRLKSEFLATVSHELRTPLNVIIGYIEMLVQGAVGDVTTEQIEMLTAVHRYTKQELELITNVLDFSRLSAGSVPLAVERFDLAALLGEVGRAYETPLRERGLEWKLEVERRLPVLETDRGKLLDVVHNLVDNAAKFATGGRISVVARAQPEPGWVTIEVVDQGPGIAAEDLSEIFNPFRQIGDSSTRATGGIGLGLSIVRQLVACLGGRITVSSTVGEGSTFRVVVPLRLAVPTPAAEASEDTTAERALDDASRNAATASKAAPARRTKGETRPPRARDAR
jgi:signal transduction histidine kinase